MVIHQDPHAFVLNKPPGLATQGGTKTHHHLDRLLDGLADEMASGRSWSTGSTRTRPARCWSRETARAAGHFAKAFSGRTARKVYWALVVGVPSGDEGLIDAAARQAARHGRREDACRARSTGFPPRPAGG